MRKAKADLECITSELKTHKTRILQMEQWNWPRKKIIEAVEEPWNWSAECGCEICRTPEKLYLRLENEWSHFTFLAERVDKMTWSTLKRFVEQMINENFQWSPKPKRKKARHAADENNTGRHKVWKDNDNTKKTDDNKHDKHRWNQDRLWKLQQSQSDSTTRRITKTNKGWWNCEDTRTGGPELSRSKQCELTASEQRVNPQL